VIQNDHVTITSDADPGAIIAATTEALPEANPISNLKRIGIGWGTENWVAVHLLAES